MLKDEKKHMITLPVFQIGFSVKNILLGCKGVYYILPRVDTTVLNDDNLT